MSEKALDMERQSVFAQQKALEDTTQANEAKLQQLLTDRQQLAENMAVWRAAEPARKDAEMCIARAAELKVCISDMQLQ